MKLTPWYPGYIKPVRKGVYMLKDGNGEFDGYQYWDGKYWNVWCETPIEAKNFKRIARDSSQNDPWRGVEK